jgi:hypothetical protein
MTDRKNETRKVEIEDTEGNMPLRRVDGGGSDDSSETEGNYARGRGLDAGESGEDTEGNGRGFPAPE